MATIITPNVYDEPTVQKAQKEYDAALEKWRNMDDDQRRGKDGKALFKLKGELMGVVRAAIRAVNRKGKRSLQEEYVRRFDKETIVKIGGKETTLHDHHAERLLK